MNRVSAPAVGPTPTPRPHTPDPSPRERPTDAAIAGKRSDALLPGIALILADPRALEMALERVVHPGIPIYTATDGVSGLRLVQGHRLGLVVVDLWLSQCPGLDVLRACSHRVPAILLTEFASPDLHAEAAAAGVVDVIVAPYRPVDVVARVSAILGPRSAPVSIARESAGAAAHALAVRAVWRPDEARHAHQ